MGLFKRKNDESDVEIIKDDVIKEPFSFDRFFDEQIMDRWRSFKTFLEEKGILFFLLSPFQFRNRVITKLVVIILGVMIGIVPRSMSIIESKKDMNASGSLVSLSGSQYSSGNAKIEPLTSSQYENKHLLTFLIHGDVSDGVPSTPDRYDVEFSEARPGTPVENLKYSFDVVPIDRNSRLLLLYVDATGQGDTTSIYDLSIAPKDASDAKLLEVSFSHLQPTTELYNENGINLNELSPYFDFNSESNIIEQLNLELEELLYVYELNEDRLLAGDIEIGLPVDALKDVIDEQLILKSVDDRSDFDSVASLDYDSELDNTNQDVPVSVIRYKDKTYNEESLQKIISQYENSEIPDKEKEAIELPLDTALFLMDELIDLNAKLSNVMSTVSRLNNARIEKYKSIIQYKDVFTLQVDLDSMIKVQ